MTARLHLRAGEVAVLFDMDATTSRWALHERLTNGQDDGAGDYGRWQGRLAVPIMQGICEDHRLKLDGAMTPEDQAFATIMPSRAWRIAPRMETDGRPAALVVTQRTGASMREWKAPEAMPPKSRMRFEAIATAYDVDHVLVGVLVDGYASHLYHVRVDEARRAEIRARCDAFVEQVRAGEEPDLDFGADEAVIRKGIAVTKVQAAAETVGQLVRERAALINERIPVDTRTKAIDARLREIDTHLIHLAGETGRLDTPDDLVTVTRDARGTAKVSVVKKAATPLF